MKLIGQFSSPRRSRQATYFRLGTACQTGLRNRLFDGPAQQAFWWLSQGSTKVRNVTALETTARMLKTTTMWSYHTAPCCKLLKKFETWMTPTGVLKQESKHYNSDWLRLVIPGKAERLLLSYDRDTQSANFWGNPLRVKRQNDT